MIVNGTLERCFAVVTDVERYPDWVPDVKEVSVLERDDLGRARLVSFRAGAFGRSAHYVLAYDYSDAPSTLSWTQRDGDITRSLEGSYSFVESANGATEVLYSLSIDLRVPVPGFVKRRAESNILHAALRDLKVRVESGS
jgi:ribosome-associated toxin RatA of RatAB toxin-antitoxin module